MALRLSPEAYTERLLLASVGKVLGDPIQQGLFKVNPFLNMIKHQTQTGERLYLDFEVAKYQVSGIDERDEVNYEHIEPFERGELPWRTLIVSPMLTQKELTMTTSGDSDQRIVGLVEKLTANAKSSLTSELNRLLMSTGTDYGAKVPVGIPYYVWNDSSNWQTDFLGRINRANVAWSKNYIKTGFGSWSANYQDIIECWRNCLDDDDSEPDLVVCAQDVWEFMMRKAMETNGLVTKHEFEDAYGGKTQLKLLSATVMPSAYVPSGYLYLLHTEYFSLNYLRGEELVVTPMEKPLKQPFMRVFNIYSTMQLACTKFACQGVVKDIIA